MAPRTLDPPLPDRVLAALKAYSAFGAAAAVTQRAIAEYVGVPTREICDATLELNLRGEPVCSTCGSPPGVFIAASGAELMAYARQLRSRLIGNGRRLAAVNRIARRLLADEAVEATTGQRRMFVNAERGMRNVELQSAFRPACRLPARQAGAGRNPQSAIGSAS